MGVGATEEESVVEEVVEIVEINAFRGAFGRWEDFCVRLVEVGGKASEEVGHGNIGFGISVVGGGIEDHWNLLGQGCDVSAPEVAMEEGWGGIV